MRSDDDDDDDDDEEEVEAERSISEASSSFHCGVDVKVSCKSFPTPFTPLLENPNKFRALAMRRMLPHRSSRRCSRHSPFVAMVHRSEELQKK